MRKAFILFLLILIAGAFVSCDLDALFGEDTIDEAPAVEGSDFTVYNNLPEDSKSAVDKIGEIYGMYAPEVARFFNGQELTDRYKDEDGNPTPVVFNSWLIAYKSLTDWVPRVFEKVPLNAMFHNDHGYRDISKLPKDLYYLEYCEYRYLETNEYHLAGDLCCIELRLVLDGVKKNQWYAKALKFDPSLRYEISTFGIDILTGNHISFNYNTGEIGEPKNIKEYDDDGILVKTTYLTPSGEVRSWATYEYNQEGNKVKSIIFDASGRKTYEYYYRGTLRSNKEQYRLRFDESGNIISKFVFEYNNADERTREIHYDSSDVKVDESIYDTLTNTVTAILHYDDGLLSIKEEFASGNPTKETVYYPSGRIKSETYFDGTGEFNIIFTEEYPDGDVVNLEIDSLDIPLEFVQEVRFSLTEPEMIVFMPVIVTEGTGPSNIKIDISVEDCDGNLIELDSSEYSFRYTGVAESDVFSDVASLENYLTSQKHLESIEFRLEKEADLDAEIKVKITGNVMLIGESDVFRKSFSADTTGLTNDDFILDFEYMAPVTVKSNEIFWYVVSKEDYVSDETFLTVLSTLGDLIEASGVVAGNYSDTWFEPNNAGTAIDLSIGITGNGTADDDIEAYFIFVKYLGTEEADFSTLTCQSEDLEELAKVEVLFHVAP